MDEWCIQIVKPKYNFFTIATKVFAANCKFSQADIAIIKINLKAHIPLIKTFGQLHNLNLGKYFTLQDHHYQYFLLKYKK